MHTTALLGTYLPYLITVHISLHGSAFFLPPASRPALPSCVLLGGFSIHALSTLYFRCLPATLFWLCVVAFLLTNHHAAARSSQAEGSTATWVQTGRTRRRWTRDGWRVGGMGRTTYATNNILVQDKPFMALLRCFRMTARTPRATHTVARRSCHCWFVPSPPLPSHTALILPFRTTPRHAVCYLPSIIHSFTMPRCTFGLFAFHDHHRTTFCVYRRLPTSCALAAAFTTAHFICDIPSSLPCHFFAHTATRPLPLPGDTARWRRSHTRSATTPHRQQPPPHPAAAVPSVVCGC